MSQVEPTTPTAASMEKLLISGDLSVLKPEERLAYYKAVCESVGLNPLTKPFEYITLNGKLKLYAMKDCTDQLRNVHSVSLKIVAREIVDECYVVTSEATLPNGRTDSSIGAVSVSGLKGDNKCNAMMKAETKSKRRVTLSICGLGMLDETEIETVPNKQPMEAKSITLVPKETSSTVTVVPQLPVNLPDGSDFIDERRRQTLARRFRESLKEDLQSNENELRHKALVALEYSGLFKSRFVDVDGNPTSDFILVNEYEAIGKALVKAAKSLG